MPWMVEKDDNQANTGARYNAQRAQPLAVGVLLGALVVFPGWSVAQSDAPQIPGLIVAVPPSTGSGQDQSIAVPAPASRSAVLRPSVAAPPAPKKRPAKKKVRRKSSKQAARSRPARAPSSRSRHSVAVLVNDEPITRHEIDQRAKLIAVSAGKAIRERANANFQAIIKRKSTNDRLRAIFQRTLEENQGQSREAIMAVFEKRKRAFARSLQRQAIASARSSSFPKYRSRATKELIEERLKLQAAKRANTLAPVADVDRAIASIAKRNKVSVDKFFKSIGSGGARPTTFKDKIRAQISWSGVIRRKFGQFISVNLKEIDQHVASVSGSSDVSLNVHKITLPLPAKLDQVSMARKLHEAELLQSKFTACNATRLLAKQVAGAKFKDMGTVSSKTIPEPTRSLLIQARDGEMVPPVRTGEGVVLYAVCGRSAKGNTDSARNQARTALQRREFDILARRHLADLKRDAHIEYR